MMKRWIAFTMVGMGLCAAVRAAQVPAPAASRASADAVVTGELVIEPPTLANLGFEWFIQGDANRNASVEVAFRKRGGAEWRPALPLLQQHQDGDEQG